jgi:hypothetical protein
VDNKSSLNYEELFYEILSEYSLYKIDNFNIYFKHPSLAENFSINSKYKLFLDEAKQKGLITEKEKIEEAINGEWWTNKKESEIKILQKAKTNLQKTKLSLRFPVEKAAIDREIKRVESILITLIKERNEILNYTAEDYANNRLVDEIIMLYTYKDSSLNNKFFNDFSDYYNIDEDFFDKLKKIFHVFQNKIGDLQIKLLAASGFVQNLVFITDKLESFWGKNLLECTKYQTDLLLYGKLYRNTIKSYAENGSPIADNILEDPEKFLGWIEDQNKSNKKNSSKKLKSKNAVSSFVGATPEDLEKMGVKVDKFKGKTLLDLAKEKGGTLEKHDYLKVRESL